MGILRKVKNRLDKAEKGMQSRLSSQAALRRPLRIQRGILDEIEDKIELGDRARLTFPFNLVTVYLMANDSAEQDLLKSFFLEEMSLEDEVRELLRNRGAQAPRKLTIDVKIVDRPDQHWEDNYFHVEFSRKPTTQPSISIRNLDSIDARLSVLKGRAAQKRYSIKKSPFNIGRLHEVTDNHRRILRRNDLVFLEKGADLSDADKDINRTVAREHAHIEFDDKAGVFRLFADRGDGVTRIFRNGKLIKVPRVNSRGIKLEAGDDIYIGEACITFETKPKNSTEDT